MAKKMYICTLNLEYKIHKKFCNTMKYIIKGGAMKSVWRIMTIAVTLLVTDAVEAQTVLSPCPEVLINEKYDHVPYRQYRAKGWDTVVSCAHPQIELSTEPYVPVQFFNGTYLVEEIPYAPADTTFTAGTRMPITTDDDFAAEPTPIPYPFYFFGIRKNAFVLGANGMVTFNTAAAGHGCAWRFSNPIPWPSTGDTSNSPHTYGMSLAMMRDAIYGVYEDTHPLASYLSGNQGIYYGIQDEFPCRKIICSWNGVPSYPGNENQNNRSTYQIVCYEGSNIIEVHVKRRGVYTNWNNGKGIIGIQNATGVPQVKSDEHDSSNYYVVNGSPAVFYPEGKNTFNTPIENVAYRFTPQGETMKAVKWYRIFDDGRDSVELGSNQNDTNGYVSMFMSNNSSDEHATLTKAVVSPRCVSRYVMELRFRNAANQWYELRDTITVGVDTVNDLRIKPMGAPQGSWMLDICQGKAAALTLDYPEGLELSRSTWSLFRILNGERIPLADSLYSLDETGKNLTVWPDPNADSILPKNKIDSIWMQATVDFVSGCSNYDSALVRIFPNFDTVDVEGICRGESFIWQHNGQSYTESTTSPKVTLTSVPGCDSVVHLHLTVFDVSHTVDHIMDCKPITWLNGVTYSDNNEATAANDTIVLKNLWGCDSVVQLDFVIHPMTPVIQSSLDHFDYDNLDVVLTDASTGNSSRLWKLPAANDQTGTTVYYSIPVELDEAKITLITTSPYGCVDSATLLLPFNKQTFWVPNAFTPDKSTNNTFGSYSKHTLSQDTYIYNRMGQLVFHCDEIDCQWDGNSPDGTPCPQGGYAYVIRYTSSFDPGKTHIVKGTVTLIR